MRCLDYGSASVVQTDRGPRRPARLYYEAPMFVKWQRRRSADAWSGGDLLMASAVESRRVDGKPRHKLITYLGSIREKHAQGGPEQAGYQDNFWQHVSERLDRTGNRFGPDDRTKIEAVLAKKVRQPIQAEIDQVLADARKELEGYRNINDQRIYPNVTEEMVRKRAGYH